MNASLGKIKDGLTRIKEALAAGNIDVCMASTYIETIDEAIALLDEHRATRRRLKNKNRKERRKKNQMMAKVGDLTVQRDRARLEATAVLELVATEEQRAAFRERLNDMYGEDGM